MSATLKNPYERWRGHTHGKPDHLSIRTFCGRWIDQTPCLRALIVGDGVIYPDITCKACHRTIAYRACLEEHKAEEVEQALQRCPHGHEDRKDCVVCEVGENLRRISD